MRRIAVLMVAALGAVLVPSNSLAQEESCDSLRGCDVGTDLVLVHGLNLDGQSAGGSGGGTVVTWCVGAEVLAPGVSFGESLRYGTLNDRPSGEPISMQVYPSDIYPEDDFCAEPPEPPLVDQIVIPDGDLMAVILTSSDPEGVPELLAVPLDYSSCTAPGTGRGLIVHAANAGEVDVVNADLGVSVGTLSYGEQIALPLSAGTTYRFEFFLVGGPAEPAATIDEFPFREPEVSTVFLVGNQPGDPPTPFVLNLLGPDGDVPGVCSDGGGNGGNGGDGPPPAEAEPTFTG